jgi:Rrf2 family protein
MLKFNRTTEYSLMALSYIRGKASGEVSSAREIADTFSLPFEILAKTLQRLKEQGIIASSYGTRGGYVLARDLGGLNLAEFLRMMEGPVSVVACAQKTIPEHQACGCEYISQCNIKPMMAVLNDRLNAFLNQISIEELTRVPLKPDYQQAQSSTAQQIVSHAVQLQGEEP